VIQAINAVCPGDPCALFKTLLSDKAFREAFKLDQHKTQGDLFELPFVRNLVTQYKLNPNNPTVQIPILSTFASDLKTFSRAFLMAKFGCGNWRLRTAQKHAASVGAGMPFQKCTWVVWRYEPEQWADLTIWSMRADVTRASRSRSTEAGGRHDHELVDNPRCGWLKYKKWVEGRNVDYQPVGEKSYRSFFESYAQSKATTCEDSVEVDKDITLQQMETEFIPILYYVIHDHNKTTLYYTIN
jgi:hypothetical protein